MYCEFFHFREKPFNMTPDPAFLYLSRNHKEAFAHLLFALKDHAGFAAITGEIGTGKTTILRSLFTQLCPVTHRIAYIFNPVLSPDEMLRTIGHEYGLFHKELSRAEMFDEINRFLLRENAQGHTVILVVDEAQNLEPEVLEQIRLLSNLETEKEKLIQILLVGQPELAELLSRSELRQLNQRISVRYHLEPLDQTETTEYIRHRLKVAGHTGRCLFSPKALRKTYQFSEGYPRLINILCDRALLFAYTRDTYEISPGIVASAIREIKGNSLKRFNLYLWGTVAGLAAAVFFIAGLFISSSGLKIDHLPFFVEHKVPREEPRPQILTVPKMEKLYPNSEDILLLRKELGELNEIESALGAFNTLSEIWELPSLAAAGTLDLPQDLLKMAQGQGVNVLSFRGGFDELVHLNTPAILELSLPGLSEKRYLTIKTLQDDQFSVAPEIGGKDVFSREEIRSIWSGKAYIFWKNFWELPMITKSGEQGQAVERLQTLLQRTGFYEGEITGRYDEPTIDAVTRFQQVHYLVQDGRVGAQTLVLLYQKAGSFEPGTLTAPDREEGGT